MTAAIRPDPNGVVPCEMAVVAYHIHMCVRVGDGIVVSVAAGAWGARPSSRRLSSWCGSADRWEGMKGAVRWANEQSCIVLCVLCVLSVLCMFQFRSTRHILSFSHSLPLSLCPSLNLLLLVDATIDQSLLLHMKHATLQPDEPQCRIQLNRTEHHVSMFCCQAESIVFSPSSRLSSARTVTTRPTVPIGNIDCSFKPRHKDDRVGMIVSFLCR